MKLIVSGLVVAAFLLGILVDARFASNRYVITEEGARLDTRTGEVVAFTSASGSVEVVIPAK